MADNYLERKMEEMQRHPQRKMTVKTPPLQSHYVIWLDGADPAQLEACVKKARRAGHTVDLAGASRKLGYTLSQRYGCRYHPSDCLDRDRPRLLEEMAHLRHVAVSQLEIIQTRPTVD